MNRRQFMTTAIGGAAAWLGDRGPAAGTEGSLETTKLRLSQIAGICVAPQYIAEELLKAEGFSDVEYVQAPGGVQTYEDMAAGKVDMSMAFVAPFIIQVDRGVPIVLLGGVHVGCFELVGTGRIRTIRDLKGKTVAVPALGTAHHVFLASMASYVGVNPSKDIRLVTHPVGESAGLLAEKKVDALMAFPPVGQELRAKKLGHVIVNSAVDRPWSQYFCCIVASNREFVRKYPVATKRALRAIVKSADVCALEPVRAARLVAGRGYDYEYALQTMKEVPYGKWREYDPEDTTRFYALRLHEAGMIKSSPQKILAQGTDWRFFSELKKELKS